MYVYEKKDRADCPTVVAGDPTTAQRPRYVGALSRGRPPPPPPPQPPCSQGAFLSVLHKTTGDKTVAGIQCYIQVDMSLVNNKLISSIKR